MACSRAPDLLRSDTNIVDTPLLFAGDNVDHYIVNLDGMGSFQRMGLMGAITSFTVKHCAKTTVVFDGYGAGPTTKDYGRKRRSRNMNANITGVTQLVEKRMNSCQMRQTTRQLSSSLRNVCEGLWGSARWSNWIRCQCWDRKSSRHKVCFQVYHPRWKKHRSPPTVATLRWGNKLQWTLFSLGQGKILFGEANCGDLLFIPAFTRCDSTSSVFGMWKKSGFQRITNNPPNCCAHQSKVRMLWKSVAAGQWWHCSMQIRMTL